MANIRVNNPGSALDQGAIVSAQANHYSGGQKVLEVGPDFQKPTNQAFVSGKDFSSGGNITPWTQMWLYNNSSTVAWVALSTATIGSAPAGFATGIPLPPNTWTRLAAGANSFIYTSAATVGVYTINDDTTVRNIDPNS
jgi:hypothetical protein